MLERLTRPRRQHCFLPMLERKLLQPLRPELGRALRAHHHPHQPLLWLVAIGDRCPSHHDKLLSSTRQDQHYEPIHEVRR